MGCIKYAAALQTVRSPTTEQFNREWKWENRLLTCSQDVWQSKKGRNESFERNWVRGGQGGLGGLQGGVSSAGVCEPDGRASAATAKMDQTVIIVRSLLPVTA